MAFKQAFQKDAEIQKEIKDLKKQDQRENYERGQAMQRIYRQMIIEKVVEKQARANKLKQNLDKIKQKLQDNNLSKFRQKAAQSNEEYWHRIEKEKKRREEEAYQSIWLEGAI